MDRLRGADKVEVRGRLAVQSWPVLPFDLVALFLSLLALLLAIRSVLAWTALDTAGCFRPD